MDDPTATSDAAVDVVPERLEPGDTLAGRYRVERFLAEGGMGAVYAAHDLVLGDRVALKTLRGGVTHDATTLARFRREIRLAHRVSHRNVCRIFDVAEHGAVPFLTMELVDGETLRDRLRRDGPLAPGAALAVAAQLCAALEAAHQAGVVHRDLKSQNVLLAEDRVVVTDFGLAHAPTLEGEITVTHQATMLGTPAYMAPEQVEGKEATAAADIYALGVVLYEMVTGRLPFTGDSAQEVATRRLTTPPPSPRQHAPALPARWEATILRCLARSPDERFASAGEVVRALRGELAPRRRRWPWLAAAALLAVTGAVALWPAAAPTTRVVAVLGLSNVSGQEDVAWLSIAATEMLEAGLAGEAAVRTVPGEEVARARRDLDLEKLDAPGADTLTRLSRRLAADVVVTGSYLVHGGRLRLQLRVQRAEDGASLGAPIVENGAADDALAVIDRAAERLRERLGLVERAGGESGLPAQPAAARLYAEGVERLRAFDPVGARERLERAVALEPDAALVHVAVADAWELAQNMTEATRALERALAVSQELPRSRRLLVEARHKRMRGDPGAVVLLRQLVEANPDDPQLAPKLVEAHIAEGRLDEATAVVRAARARATTPYASLLLDDAELAISEVSFQPDRVARSAALALAGGRRAQALGARRAAALLLGKAAWYTSATDQVSAERLLAEARALADDPDADLASALAHIARLMASRTERWDDCPEALRAELAWARHNGNVMHELMVLHNSAVCLLALGDPVAAELRAHEGLVLVERPVPGMREPPVVSRILLLNDAINARMMQGDLAGAAPLLAQVDRLASGPETATLRMSWQVRRARLWYAQDRLDEAYAELTTLLPLAYHEGGGWMLWLARVALASGRADHAAAIARGLVDREHGRRFRLRAPPLEVLLRAQVARGEDVRAVAAELAALVPFVEDVPARARALIALVVAGRLPRTALTAVVDDARRRRDVWTELEARLAAGDPTLAADARARGFLLIARQASPPP